MEWMQEEVLNVSKNTQDAVIRKNLFHTKSYENRYHPGYVVMSIKYDDRRSLFNFERIASDGTYILYGRRAY